MTMIITERAVPVTNVEKQRKPFRWGIVITYAILIVGGLIMMYPLLFAFMASIGTQADYTRSTWIPVPTEVTFTNYERIFRTATKLPLWIFNTLIRVGWYILIPAIVSILGGYVFARLRFRGRDTVFSLLLTSMMIPGIVYFVPSYVMLARWPLAGGNNILGQGGSGFVNQWPALLLTGLLNVYYIFLMRQTFYTIPKDFEEAARVDGASFLQILFRVYLPMISPALAVLVIFQTIALWNDYVWPLIVAAGNTNIWPVALGFQRLMLEGARVAGGSMGTAAVDQSWAFTVAVIATLPLVLMFLVLQRYFVQGVQGFSLKG